MKTKRRLGLLIQIKYRQAFFVTLSAQPTRLATLHSEFPKVSEYNSSCVVKSQNVLGDY